MNKEFVKKIIKAKKLECEAIMEIMPEPVKRRVEKFEKEAIDLSKEIILELINDKEFMTTKKSANNEKDENLKSNIKKVKVEFEKN